MANYTKGDTPPGIALPEEEIKRRADAYEKDWGWMCRNAHYRACKVMHMIGADALMPNSREIDQELAARGYKSIENKEEYEAMIAEHGEHPSPANFEDLGIVDYNKGLK